MKKNIYLNNIRRNEMNPFLSVENKGRKNTSQSILSNPIIKIFEMVDEKNQ